MYQTDPRSGKKDLNLETTPGLLTSRDFVGLIRAPSHWTESNDSQKIRSFSKQCFC